jgi:phage-related holin
MNYVIVGCFIVLDILTGTIYALKSKTWTSTKMREGGYHKIAIVISIALATLIDFGEPYLNLGFNIPVAKFALGYVGIMELGSTAENLVKINPQLKELLTKIFSKEK